MLGPLIEVAGYVLIPAMWLLGLLDFDFVLAFAAVVFAFGVFVSVADRDKRSMLFPVKRLADLGFAILATAGTASVLARNGVHAVVVRKHSEGRGPGDEPIVVERILHGEVDMVVNTPSGRAARADGYEIRAAAVATSRPILTTVQELGAAVQGIEALLRGEVGVRSLQSWAQDRASR